MLASLGHVGLGEIADRKTYIYRILCGSVCTNVGLGEIEDRNLDITYFVVLFVRMTCG